MRDSHAHRTPRTHSRKCENASPLGRPGMRLRLCAPLVALLGSLSLAVPAWAAGFGTGASRPTITDQTFGLPGSDCSGTYTAPVSLSLPEAVVLSSQPTYTLTDGTCTPSTGKISCGLPSSLTLTTEATGKKLVGTLAADLKTATAAHYSLTWTVTDNAGSDSLTFEIAIADERPVLEDLYTHTNGGSWTINTNWAADIPATTCLHDLHGITLQGDGTGSGVGRVSEIDLSHNHLTGAMPESLGNPDHGHDHSGHEDEEMHEDEVHLKRLKVLNLSHNHLTGAMPEGLGLLYALNELNLSHNTLTGQIPEDVTHAHFLNTLDLSHNTLTGPVPEAVLHDGFTHPGHTEHVNLSHNRLTGKIPESLGLLMPDLLTLDLSHNTLSEGIPTNLPSNLRTLALHNNQLTGKIPPEVGNLTSLQSLSLHNNQLSGAIPDLSGLTSLPQLDLSHNRLSEFPTKPDPNNQNSRVLALPPNVQALNLSHNQLNEVIPAAIGNPSTLHTLDLSHNQLNGAIPSELSSLSGLESLALHNNQLTGNLTRLSDPNNPNSPQVSVLPPNLTTLYLHTNRLSGALTRLADLANLEELSLYGNLNLFGYPAALNTKTALRLLAPGNGTAVCLYGDADGATGTTECSVPTLVDKLRAQVSPTRLVFSWAPHPADPAPSGYVAQSGPPGGPWTDVEVTGATATLTGLTPAAEYSFLVRTADTPTSPRLYYVVTLPTPTPPRRPPTTGGNRGGGGGTRTPPDQHGDTPAEATSLNPRRYTTGSITRRLDARLQSQRDVDYFQLDLPHAGVLTASTTGSVDTTGRLSQVHDDGEPILVAADTARGPFELGVAVEPGTYYLAVSAGTSFGDYRLLVDYTPAFVDNPAPDSPQSGLGVLSGWVCAAESIEIELVPASGEPQTLVPATNTSRADTAGVCGAETTDTGFGLLFNWNLLGDGQHTVRILIADVVFAEREITVTTLGDHPDQEYRRELRSTTTLPDFPTAGQTTTLRWAEALQNFVLAAGEGGSGGEQVTPEQARLENPAPGSFQSGLGVISGWVCEADTVEIVFEPGGTDDTLAFEAGSGTERLDTADRCGDTDTGFGLLFNWNLLGDGQHTVRAYADGEEFAHSTVTVTPLDGEFARGLRRTHTIEDFPEAGQTTTVEWREGQQNFVITAVE